MLVIGARASAVCKRMLVSHLTPPCEGSRRVKLGGINLAGVSGCVANCGVGCKGPHRVLPWDGGVSCTPVSERNETNEDENELD